MGYFKHDRSAVNPAPPQAFVDIVQWNGHSIKHVRAEHVLWGNVTQWRHAAVGIDIDKVHDNRPKALNHVATVSIDIETGEFPLEVLYQHYPGRKSSSEDPGSPEQYEFQRLTLIVIDERIDFTAFIDILDDVIIEKLEQKLKEQD